MPRAGLDREVVLGAAAKIADEDGLAALTLARLAERLNVRSPSLYKYVAGLPDIQREMTREGFRLLNARLRAAIEPTSGDAALLALAEAVWRFAREHPGLYAATLQGSPANDPELAAAGSALIDTVAQVLRGYGLAGNDLLHAVRATRAIVHGFVSLHAAGGFRLPLEIEESLRRLVLTYAEGLRARLSGSPAELSHA